VLLILLALCGILLYLGFELKAGVENRKGILFLYFFIGVTFAILREQDFGN